MQYPLWEQGVLSSNLSAPTIQIQLDHEVFAPSENFAGVASVGGAFFAACHAVDIPYLLPHRSKSAPKASHAHSDTQANT